MSEIFRTFAWLALFAATMHIFFPEMATTAYNRYVKEHYEQWSTQPTPTGTPAAPTNPTAASLSTTTPTVRPTPSDRFRQITIGTKQ